MTIDIAAVRKLAKSWCCHMDTDVLVKRERAADEEIMALDVLDLADEVERLQAEVERLETRQRELLVTIRNLSASTPYPEEARNAATLIAEVGTLRSRLAEVEIERDEANLYATRMDKEVDVLRESNRIITDRTTEAIAAWVVTRATRHPGFAQATLELAAAIRAGQHKEP